MKQANQQKGRVIIAGAGPGDPELLTLKTARFLQQAEVVITDRLVSETILENYVNKEALILHVGKQCRKGASTPQSTINELLVEYALQGKLVVRLKGGDVSIFSNILDELEALKKHGVNCEIVPGVTAALGAAAYAGIPLTARDHATAVRLLTFYKSNLLDRANWEELAKTDDTLVFYMSGDTSAELVQHLIDQGISNEKHIAVIEQATTPMQQVYSCNVHDYAEKWGNNHYVSPTLIIIGKVAALHQQFKWMENTGCREEYFAPLAKTKAISVRA